MRSHIKTLNEPVQEARTAHAFRMGCVGGSAFVELPCDHGGRAGWYVMGSCGSEWTQKLPDRAAETRSSWLSLFLVKTPVEYRK